MDKVELFTSLKQEYAADIIDIEEVNNNKVLITVAEDSPYQDVIKRIRNSIFLSRYNRPIIVEVINGELDFNFSIFGDIYEFNLAGIHYIVEYGSKTCVVKFTGFFESVPTLDFLSLRQYRGMLRSINDIKLQRAHFLGI